MLRARLLALLLLAVASACSTQRPSAALSAPAPAVRRIFVEPFGTTADAVNARAQLIDRIAARERFTIVDDLHAADAVLRGAIELRMHQGSWPNPVRGYGALTLEARESGRVLWRAEYDRWNPTDPAVESTPAAALERTVAFFDSALHQASQRSVALIARQPNDGW